ncbi:hypothetical protein LOK49_LG06G02954 [Camellia lanceoleosa]|uniref:Uncharacterized protein n=1 Tax=Camellia lanceoleosa TaxID=1840588 RepID=A0ACC0HCZ2_9ERIC|nr:hypothetical protein LOK49_LG06G02954 [Camellia lanceoleosa]
MASMRAKANDRRRIRSIVKDLVTDSHLTYPSMDLLRLLFWNFQRANNNNFKRNLTEIIRTHNPKILVLLETKDASQVIAAASLVTPQAIHATTHKADYDEWVLAAVYASHNPVMRDHLWDDLEDVAETMDMPWLVMGDFNDFATQGERRSFNPRTTTVRNQKFLDRVNNCNLINLRSSVRFDEEEEGVEDDVEEIEDLEHLLLQKRNSSADPPEIEDDEGVEDDVDCRNEIPLQILQKLKMMKVLKMMLSR